jgi:SAM-dependent methyltransferase
MLNLSKQERYRARYRQMQPGYRPALDVYTTFLAECITPQTRLLDVGCGPGGLVASYEGVVQQVIGVDAYASRFDQPAELHTLVEGDGDRLPFPASTFDLVTCSWVLEHLHQPAITIAEICRVLKPGGRLLFITPNTLNYVVWLRRLIPNRFSKSIVHRIYGRDEDFINPTYYRANTYRQIESLMVQSGFVCERFEHISDPTYLALNDLLFYLSVGIERLLDRVWRSSRVHLVGVYRKAG